MTEGISYGRERASPVAHRLGLWFEFIPQGGRRHGDWDSAGPDTPGAEGCAPGGQEAVEPRPGLWDVAVDCQ